VRDDQHGARREPHEPIGDAAEQEAPDAAVPVRAEHHGVRGVGVRVARDLIGGRADGDRGDDAIRRERALRRQRRQLLQRPIAPLALDLA